MPKVVLLSIALLLATHAVGLWGMVKFCRTLAIALWMPYATLALAYSLLAAFLFMILLGKRWARAAHTCLAVISVLASLATPPA